VATAKVAGAISNVAGQIAVSCARGANETETEINMQAPHLEMPSSAPMMAEIGNAPLMSEFGKPQLFKESPLGQSELLSQPPLMSDLGQPNLFMPPSGMQTISNPEPGVTVV
jgi:hypothetical protein